MNGYNYQSTGMNHNQLPQLTPLSNLPTRPYQQDSPGPSQTLPPLHTQTNHPSYPSNVYRDSPQTPRTPQGPAPSTGQQRTANLSQIAPQPAYPGQHQPQYPPLAPNYSAGPPQSYPAIPAPHANQANGSNGPYAPMTLPQPPFYESPHGQDPSLTPNSQYSNLNQSSAAKDMQQRVLPVVGSQGRRGVLPTANGRTAPPIVGSADGPPASRVTATKGPDGRYSCQYCNKVYLHLKHLKRHHLRHTGERPYQCHLCHETFCRSDILKRHFSKCALRRGNPTGANHLTHAQAHLGRAPNMSANSSQAQQANGSNVSVQPSNPTLYRSSWQNEPTGPAQAGQDHVASHAGGAPLDSNMSSRSSSIIRPGSSNADDKKRFSGTNTNITSINNSIDTSPTGAGEDRKPTLLPNTSKNEILPQQQRATTSYATQQSNFYGQQPGGAYSQSIQTASFPSYQYSSPNGYRGPYHQQGYDTMSGEHLSHYFQPGGQDAVMFTHQ